MQDSQKKRGRAGYLRKQATQTETRIEEDTFWPELRGLTYPEKNGLKSV
jgi:hypothetical protein